MLRKLAVTLAGSTIKDPYLQILAALLILVASCVATAYVQPYETAWLNLMDTISLFALIVTQIFSILYFYTSTSTNTFADSKDIEISVTCVLFVVNALVVVVFGGLFCVEVAGLRNKWHERRSAVFKVANAAQTRTALLAGAECNVVTNDQRWCHPNGVAVQEAPVRGATGIWIWIDPVDNSVAASRDAPELLLLVESAQSLRVGADFRWVHSKTLIFSTKQTKPRDVGGCACGAGAAVDNTMVADDDVELNFTNEMHAGGGHKALIEERAKIVELETEIVELKREIDRFKMENDLLKRARNGELEGSVVVNDHGRDGSFELHDNPMHRVAHEGSNHQPKERRHSEQAAKDQRRLGKRARLDKLKRRADDAATETRVDADGFAYTKALFVKHYGGTEEWDGAEPHALDQGW